MGDALYPPNHRGDRIHVAQTLRFRWQVAGGSLRMTCTADAVELDLDTTRRNPLERAGLDAPDVLADPAPLRGWARA